MRLLASSLLLSLAWFAAVNAAATVIVVAALAARRRPARHAASSPARAKRLLAIRLFPVASAAFVAGVLFLPTHFALEPESSFAGAERLGALLTLLALCGAGLLLRSAWRVASLLRAGRHLRVAAGRGVAILDAAAVPGISLAGVFRPRVLIGRGVRETLTDTELEVAIAHELAHDRARDNLTRFVLYTAPDFFAATGAARRLEEQWRAEAECLADARAARGDERRAAALASALVKVARLAGASDHPRPLVWSTFHEAALLEARVRLLVDGGTTPPQASIFPAVSLAVVAVALAAWVLEAPVSLHYATEALIRLLP